MSHSKPGDRRSPLRLALLTCHHAVESWQLAAIERLDENAACIALRIDLVPEDIDATTRTSDRGLRSRAWTSYRQRRLERPARAWHPRPADTVAPDTPVHRGRLILGRSGRLALDPATVAAVRTAGCDAVLNLTNVKIEGLEAADVRDGMWEHRVSLTGDRTDLRDLFRSATAPALLEVGLVRVGRDEVEDVSLQRGWVHTVPRSWAASIDVAHFTTAEWLNRTCRSIVAFGAVPEDDTPPRPPADLRDPSNVRVVVGSPWRRLRWALRQLVWQEEWHVGVVDRPIAELFHTQRLGDPRWLRSPSRRHYLADPFGLADSDVVLAEDFDYITRRGFIAALHADAAASRPAVQAVLRTTGHMSYPYLLQWDGDVFCVPETSDQRRATLFRARRYPNEWEEIAVLVEDLAVTDPTIVRHDRRWWLFCTDDELGPGSNLHIYHADHLEGPWRPHDRNPVKIDIRSARPAGTPFVVDGALIRPAQENTAGYGSGVVFNKIEHLSPDTFEERPVAHLQPDPGSTYRHGVHTVSAWGERTLIDGKRKGPSMTNLLGRIRSLVR